MTNGFHVATIGILTLAAVSVSCQHAGPEAPAPGPSDADRLSQPAAGDLASATDNGGRSTTLTERQREVILRVTAAGGAMDGADGEVPQSIDLASDRVFADDALVRALAEFPQLQRLRLAAANTTPDAFQVLESLNQLTELFLQDAPLSDRDLAPALSAMPKLERLTLRRLSGVSDAILPALASCRHLKMLALIEMNNVSGSTLSGLRSIESLRSLDVRNCGKLQGDDFRNLLVLTQITELKLGGPTVNDDVLGIVAEHPSITSLVIEDAEVSGECLQRLAAEERFAARLHSLSFARCFGVSDETLGSLTQFPQLRALSLRSIFVTGSFLATMHDTEAGIPQLTTLIVTNGFLDDASIDRLPKLFPQLVRLELNGNAGITDASRAVFDKLNQLKQLQLVGTGVSDPPAAREK